MQLLSGNEEKKANPPNPPLLKGDESDDAIKGGIIAAFYIYNYVNIGYKETMIFEWDENKNRINKAKHGIALMLPKWSFLTLIV